MSKVFLSLCEELACMQLLLLRRSASPSLLAQEAIQLIRQNAEHFQLTSSAIDAVPRCLSAGAALLQHAASAEEMAALDALDVLFPLADGYVGSTFGDLNSCSSVLRSVMSLGKMGTEFLERNHPSGPRGVQFDAGDSFCYHNLMPVAHQVAFDKWTAGRSAPTPLSLLTLLQGTSAVGGRGFVFPPANAEITGLLPLKSKVRMKAKMQRCSGARELLGALAKIPLNRIDAGMCVTTMAETGLYDPEVCNKSCNVLYSAHAMLSSEQLCQVLYALGVLQHRHVYQKFFSSLVIAKEITADAARRHAMGLAMLQQPPPPTEEHFMDGIFLHALRSSRAANSHHGGSSPSAHSRQHVQNSNQLLYHLEPSWFIDVGHALSCLGIHHTKYCLMTARTVRRSLGFLTTLQRCKLLYALGSPRMPGEVPAELQHTWQSKVMRAVNITVEKLNDIDMHDGPQVMSALRYCGIREHSRIPRVPHVKEGTCDTTTRARGNSATEHNNNPVDAILQAWGTTPKERLLQLTEKIELCYLGEAPSRTLAEVVAAVAGGCGYSPESSARFEVLCAAVDTHRADMTVTELLATLGNLQRLGISAQYIPTLQHLMDTLWEHRGDLTKEQMISCGNMLHQFHRLPSAQRLLRFVSCE